MGVTSDPFDPRLTRGVDDGTPREQADMYLVLPDDGPKSFVRPVRRSYLHLVCGAVTTMGQPIAETYAREPTFYGATYCCRCLQHCRVGAEGEFVWIEADGSEGPKVGT